MVMTCSGAFGHTLGTRPVACGATPDLGKPLRASFSAFLQLGLRVLLGSIQGESGLAARSVSPCLGAWVSGCWVAWGCGGRGFKSPVGLSVREVGLYQPWRCGVRS
jgi:hypothetical protein